MAIITKHYAKIVSMIVLLMLSLSLTLPIIIAEASDKVVSQVEFEGVEPNVHSHINAMDNHGNSIEVGIDPAKHFIIGPEVVYYLKAFCWVVGGMFGILTFVSAGLGWFFKRTLDGMATTNRNQWAAIGVLRTDVDRIIGEHDLRGELCPGLRPDVLRNVVAEVLGIRLGVNDRMHRREDDEAGVHTHHRSTNGNVADNEQEEGSE